MSKEKIEIPSQDSSKVIAFGFGILFIVFVVLGGWMAYAPLATSAVAVGTVSADLGKKTIQHLEGGMVEEINVKDGDFVRKGQILLKLKDIHIIGQIQQIKKQKEGLTAVIKSKVSRLDSLTEEIMEWEKLYKQQLIDKLKIRTLKREKNYIEGEIAKSESEIAKLEEQRIVLEDMLSRAKIISPIDGTVIGLEMHTVGGVLAPGKPILEIVPKGSSLIIVAQVNPADIDKVKMGLTADIRFSAFDMQQTGVIEGKIIHISADSFTNDSTGIPYYKAKIKVTKKGNIQLKEFGFSLLSGMPAEVMINTGDRTVLSYLLKPLTDMISRGFNEE